MFQKIQTTLLLIILIIMAIVVFRQNVLLTEQNHLISNLEVKIEDLDDAIEEQIIPALEDEEQ
ncbi:hypothetical protein [Rossellomorea aquimaris]|jgi:hypothetical protein|uniref:hypothetical protein n=1 Tax=Rossellomorea aquimaris TaxID=189382 RepID=UPI0011E8A534|nr:hypothetical protein [Rossellomorea aquimaris]TYS89982.1 hypothetical protein FZC88_10410 [Rossellomorea aquimaris]